MAGEALCNDESLQLTAEQAIFITQIIAEWSFHKTIDLVHSGIDRQYWDGIMQKIAFTIFEVAKQAITRNIPQEQLLQAVEHHVIKVYKQSIEELQQKGIIDEQTMVSAQNQSNIDVMAQQAQAAQQQAEQQNAEERRKEAQKRREEKRNQKRQEKQEQQQQGSTAPAVRGINERQMKLISLAMLLKIVSKDKAAAVISNFNESDSKQLQSYMEMVNLESQLDGDLLTACLKEMRQYLPIKHKLTQENVLGDLLRIYRSTPREKVEKIIRNERPLVKRFIARAYDGEYSGLPLKVAGIVAQHVQDSI
jgi:hypothetical protein